MRTVGAVTVNKTQVFCIQYCARRSFGVGGDGSGASTSRPKILVTAQPVEDIPFLRFNAALIGCKPQDVLEINVDSRSFTSTTIYPSYNGAGCYSSTAMFLRLSVCPFVHLHVQDRNVLQTFLCGQTDKV